MKILKTVPAYLLALVYVVLGGANFFLHFIPTPPMPPGPVATYTGLLYTTGYLTFVKICEIVFGLLLVFKPTRALGYILIAPISVNILLFEVFIAHQPGIGVALVLLNALGIFLNKDKYIGIVQ